MHTGGVTSVRPTSEKMSVQVKPFFFGLIMNYSSYEREKAAWLRANPQATPQQIERAFQAIAKRLGV